MDTNNTPPNSWRQRLESPRVRGALALLVVIFLVLTGGPMQPAEPAPLPVRLSDVEVLAQAGALDRVGFDDDNRTLVMWVSESGRAAALEAAEVYATDNELDEVVAPPVDEDFIVFAHFPVQYGGTLTETLLAEGVTVGASPPVRPNKLLAFLASLVPFMLILGVLLYVYARQGSGVAKLTGGRDSAVAVPSTRFSDVAGVDEAVDDLTDMVAYLHEPTRYAATGARAPKGILLEGPPGTGKTLLARAIAGEAGVPFYSLSGSDFVETFVGVGAKRVRELFSKARKNEGASVIFIDEIDAIGRSRSTNPGYGNEETERTLNALLVEMDGFDKESEIIVIAATNRADMLDAALTRPGRFDRRVTVPAPDRGGRSKILAIHARGKQVADDVDLDSFARRTPGMTGAELENLLNTAAINAASDGDETIRNVHLEEALQTIALGRARTSALVTERDRVITAWHEGGHTLAALVQEDADDPVTVTIIPRGPAGGVTWMSGNDRQFLTRSEAKAQLVVAMAGRAAEELLLDGEFTQGASGDLQSATELAFKMVTQYGMTGTLSVHSGERYQAGGSSKVIDDAVEQLLQEALVAARALLADNRELFDRLVELLLEHETVDQGMLETLRD